MRVCATCRAWDCGGCYGGVDWVDDPEADAAFAAEMEEDDRQSEEWRSRGEAEGDSRRRWWRWW
jgi:hypothetical protein